MFDRRMHQGVTIIRLLAKCLYDWSFGLDASRALADHVLRTERPSLILSTRLFDVFHKRKPFSLRADHEASHVLEAAAAEISDLLPSLSG